MKQQRGASLVTVLLAGALLAFAFAAAAVMLDRANQFQSLSKLDYGANALAMAGLEDARARLQLNQDADLSTPNWNYTAGQAGSYRVTVTRPAPNLRQVTSTGTAATRSVTVTKTYDMGLPPAFQAPLFSNVDLDLRGVTSLNGSIRTNGTLTMGNNTALGQGVTLNAGGDILMGNATCLLTQCNRYLPVVAPPSPSEPAVRQGAYEIVLTAANTDRGVYYIGGSSGGGKYAGFAQDTTDATPFDFAKTPTIYIRSGDGGSYTVYVSTLTYKGRGTIAAASSNINLIFLGSATIRRAQSSLTGSCIAFLPFQTGTVVQQNNVTLEGILIARTIELGNNANINGVIAANQFTGTGHVNNLTLRSDAEIVQNAPATVFTYAAP